MNCGIRVGADSEAHAGNTPPRRRSWCARTLVPKERQPGSRALPWRQAAARAPAASRGRLSAPVIVLGTVPGGRWYLVGRHVLAVNGPLFAVDRGLSFAVDGDFLTVDRRFASVGRAAAPGPGRPDNPARAPPRGRLPASRCRRSYGWKVRAWPRSRSPNRRTGSHTAMSKRPAPNPLMGSPLEAEFRSATPLP